MLGFLDKGVDVLSGATAIYNVVACVVFIITYHRHRYHAWRDTWFGRSVMTLAAAVLWFSLLGLLASVLGPNYWGADVLRWVGRMAVAVAMTQRLVVLIMIDREDKTRSAL